MDLELLLDLVFLALMAGAALVIGKLAFWLQNRWDTVQGVVVDKEHVPDHEETFTVHGLKRGSFHVPEHFLVKVKGVNGFGVVITVKAPVSAARFPDINLGDRVTTAEL